jgi:type III restriction enzyme
MKAIRDNLKEQVGKATELEFRRMLSVNELSFRLEASNDPVLNWELAETLELDVTEEDKFLLRKNGEPLEKSIRVAKPV